MRPLSLLVSAVLAVACSGEPIAMGQMFGRGGTTNPSSRGGSLLDAVGSASIGTQYGANAAAVGTLQGTERFLRSNRQGAGFIGIDRGDRRRFVGAAPATTTGARPAIPTVRIERASPQGQVAPPARRRAGMYEPPLEIGFDYVGPVRREVSVAVAQHLRSSPALDPANRIEVLVEGTTATLRGEVVSERDRALAEQLALFEPGVYAVRNELRVQPPGTETGGWRPSPPSRVLKATAANR